MTETIDRYAGDYQPLFSAGGEMTVQFVAASPYYSVDYEMKLYTTAGVTSFGNVSTLTTPVSIGEFSRREEVYLGFHEVGSDDYGFTGSTSRGAGTFYSPYVQHNPDGTTKLAWTNGTELLVTGAEWFYTYEFSDYPISPSYESLCTINFFDMTGNTEFDSPSIGDTVSYNGGTIRLISPFDYENTYTVGDSQQFRVARSTTLQLDGVYRYWGTDYRDDPSGVEAEQYIANNLTRWYFSANSQDAGFEYKDARWVPNHPDLTWGVTVRFDPPVIENNNVVNVVSREEMPSIRVQPKASTVIRSKSIHPLAGKPDSGGYRKFNDDNSPVSDVPFQENAPYHSDGGWYGTSGTQLRDDLFVYVHAGTVIFTVDSEEEAIDFAGNAPYGGYNGYQSNTSDTTDYGGPSKAWTLGDDGNYYCHINPGGDLVITAYRITGLGMFEHVDTHTVSNLTTHTNFPQSACSKIDENRILVCYHGSYAGNEAWEATIFTFENDFFLVGNRKLLWHEGDPGSPDAIMQAQERSGCVVVVEDGSAVLAAPLHLEEDPGYLNAGQENIYDEPEGRYASGTVALFGIYWEEGSRIISDVSDRNDTYYHVGEPWLFSHSGGKLDNGKAFFCWNDDVEGGLVCVVRVDKSQPLNSRMTYQVTYSYQDIPALRTGRLVAYETLSNTALQSLIDSYGFMSGRAWNDKYNPDCIYTGFEFGQATAVSKDYIVTVGGYASAGESYYNPNYPYGSAFWRMSLMKVEGLAVRQVFSGPAWPYNLGSVAYAGNGHIFATYGGSVGGGVF